MFTFTKKTNNLLSNLLVLILCAIALFLYKDELFSFKLNFSWHYLLSITIVALSTLVGGFNWLSLVKSLSPSQRLEKNKTILNHLKAWIFRYIPGFGYFGYKIISSKNQGLSKSLTSSAIIHEQVLIQLTSFLLGAGFLIFGLYGTVSTQNLLLFLLGVLIIWIVILAKMDKILDLLTFKIRKLKGLRAFTLTRRQMVVQTLKYTFARLLISLGVILTAIPNTKSTVESSLIIAGAYLVALAAGILAVFSPSGIGVREIVFTTIASLSGIPIADAIFLSILLRAVTTIADLILGIVIVLLQFFQKSN